MPLFDALALVAPQLEVGDVVFIRVGARPFREVAEATGSWTNHVGIVTGFDDAGPRIGESTFPLSRQTSLARFVARSERGRFAVHRLSVPASAGERQRITAAARRRDGIFYDTGFDLRSRRQFCSRYVHEVLMEATGRAVGEVETFAHLLSRRPAAALGFWKLWYFGRIPWQRETITPASLLESDALRPLFDSASAPESGAPPQTASRPCASSTTLPATPA